MVEDRNETEDFLIDQEDTSANEIITQPFSPNDIDLYNPQNEMLTFCKTKRSNSKTKRYYFRPPLQLYDNSVKTDFLSDFNAIIFEKL